jgi:hypothetical protein
LTQSPNSTNPELADFEKNTDSVTRNRYRKAGLDSRLVKAAFDKYVAKK